MNGTGHRRARYRLPIRSWEATTAAVSDLTQRVAKLEGMSQAILALAAVQTVSTAAIVAIVAVLIRTQ